ncbi:MAG: metallophosphoesterase [Bacteroidales bacterium]|nr:metallophosphoesterase [Bacteroidales bacterium]
MRGGSLLFLIFIILFLGIVDFYTFRSLRIVTSDLSATAKLIINILFWLIPVIIISLMFILAFNMRKTFTTGMFRVWYFLMGFFAIFYIPKLVIIPFQLGNDLVRLSGFIISKLSGVGTRAENAGEIMSRAEFLTKTGIIVAAIPFVSVIHGIVRGRFNYKVKNLKLSFSNLPEAFNGFRVLQISDWHIGSFSFLHNKVKESIDLINKQNADIILFTGDMVNNVASEVKDFIPLLKELKAPYGIYSILGNHDYGEYVRWDSEEEHAKNMDDLYSYEAKAGFNLLRNDSVIIERGKEKIGIAGVENWGLPPFPQYGDLKKALFNIKDIPFKILMSHDPSHWDAEVINKTNIDLTLSGHTHGMQFGINIPGIKWSPVKWKYPRWNGLYQESNQYLYVNVGIGYIGFPGRVGFYPEITVFTLQKS